MIRKRSVRGIARRKRWPPLVGGGERPQIEIEEPAAVTECALARSEILELLVGIDVLRAAVAVGPALRVDAERVCGVGCDKRSRGDSRK
jgi:hypothetical protein